MTGYAVLGILAIILTPASASAPPAQQFLLTGLSSTASGAPEIAQDEGAGEEAEVPPHDIEKYVAVYKAMQRDRGLTVDQAAAQQGMTLAQFRDLESRVQRDDAALQHARDELQASAVQSSPKPEASAGAPKAP